MAAKSFSIVVLVVGGLATSLSAQTDDGRDRPSVSTEMHGAAAGFQNGTDAHGDADAGL